MEAKLEKVWSKNHKSENEKGKQSVVPMVNMGWANASFLLFKSDHKWMFSEMTPVI